MKTHSRIPRETLFITFSSFFLLIGLSSTLLVEFGQFYRHNIFLSVIGSFVFSVLIYLYFVRLHGLTGLARRAKTHPFLPGYLPLGLTSIDIVTIILVLFFATLNTVFFHDVFSGSRDNGVLPLAGIYIANHHTDLIPAYLRIPGWLPSTSEFSGFGLQHSYPGWLGTLYTFFGIYGINFSNFFLIIIGYFSIYLICTYINSRIMGLASLVLIGTSYPFLWFTKSTYNEIYFFAWIWFSVFTFLLSLKMKNNLLVLLSVVSLVLATMVRTEGWASLVIFTGMIVYFKLKSHRWINLLTVTSVLSVLLLVLSIYYVRTERLEIGNIARQFANQSWEEVSRHAVFLTRGSASNALGFKKDLSAIRYHFPEIVFLALNKFNMSLPVIFIGISLATLIIRRSATAYWREGLAIVMLVASPSLIFLNNPYVTLDLPWMLKRFVPIFIPLVYILLANYVLLNSSKKFFLLCLTLLVTVNLVIASPLIFIKQDEGGLGAAMALSNIFSKNDLVLVDRYATGNYKLGSTLFLMFDIPSLWVWIPTSESLGGNKELQSKLDDFDNVYLVADSQSKRLINTFVPQSSEIVYRLSYSSKELEPTLDLHHLSEAESVSDVYDLDINLARSLIKVPKRILDEKYTIQVYRVDRDLVKHLISNGDENYFN